MKSARAESFAILAYQNLSTLVNFNWRRLPATARPCFPRMTERDLIFTGLAGGSTEASFPTEFSLMRAGRSMILNILRGGFLVTVEPASVDTNNQVFPVDAAGNQTLMFRLRSLTTSAKTGAYYGFYLQDEWKVFAAIDD